MAVRKMFATDSGEFSLLDVRKIELNVVEEGVETAP